MNSEKFLGQKVNLFFQIFMDGDTREATIG